MRKQSNSVLNMEPNLLLRIIKNRMEAANPNWDESSCPGAVWDLLLNKKRGKKQWQNNVFHDDTRFCWIPPSGRWKRSTPPLTVARLMLSSQSVTQSEQPYCLKHQKMVTVTTLRAWKTFQTELSAGSDGRADFVERKACNWITDTFQVDFVELVVVVVVVVVVVANGSTIPFRLLLLS